VGFFHSVEFLDSTGPKTTIRGPCPLLKFLHLYTVVIPLS